MRTLRPNFYQSTRVASRIRLRPGISDNMYSIVVNFFAYENRTHD